MFDDVNEDYYWLDLKDDAKTRRLKKLRFYRNQERGVAFEEKMFLERKSYRIIFLTLSLNEGHREDVSMRTMKRYRDRFFRHIREYVNDELLSGVHGVVWRLEEGGRGGSLHLHLVIFYSTGRSGDVKIGKELGEYWIDEITHGWGDYWNSNARKSEFEHRWGVGVGLVGRNNHEMRESLRKIIGSYMVKTTQVPKSRGMDDKLFGIVRFRRNRRR